MKLYTPLAALLAVVTGSLLTLAAPVKQPSPNIVFVFADQWRACSTGYAGDPNVKTPNLDKLEKQSANFTKAVSACPVCTPFRGSLMTGQRPTTHGLFLNDAHLSDNAMTLGKALSANGYDTGYIGKWHLNGRGRLSYIPPENRQGFHYWKAMECTHDYNHSFYYADDDSHKKEWPGYDAFAQTDDAIGYIRDRAKDGKRFALFLAWGPPHNPYETAPAEYRKMYDPAKIQLRPNVPPEAAAEACKDLAGYYAHCSALDHCIGRLWDALKKAGVEENTLIVFTSDHGDMIGSHQMGRKQKPWDEALRTPMLWHYPAGLGRDGKRLDAVISSEDLMPTLLGLCGVAIPKSVEGLDYSGYLRGGENPNGDNAALISCVAPFGEWSRKAGGREFRGVRTGRYTYVRDLNGPWLLYDDEKDPYQMVNLAKEDDAADVRLKLDALLQRRLKAAGDEFKPAAFYLDKWGYKDRVDDTGTLPTKP
jgi:arylsulfatase A-like enzyme